MLGPSGLRQLTLAASVALAGLALALSGCSELATEVTGGPEPHSARVAKHTDGDTLWLSGIGKVRLIGVDTPEVYGEVECYGPRASAFVERTVPLGSRVRYSLGVEERDRYGRALAYVWLTDGRFLNRLLLARGLAEPLTIAPNDEYEVEFARVSDRARAAGRGLWRRPGCA